MTKKILAFGASSSTKSINKQFASYAAHQFENGEVDLMDLNDFEMPLFSIDKEEKNGIPQLAHQFKERIKSCDFIVISFAEHNGAYSTAFKNIFDWISRIEKNVWYDKPMFLLSTSPGARGGATVLEIATNKLSRMTTGHTTSFSLPSFKENFDVLNGITNKELKKEFDNTVKKFVEGL